MTNRFAVYHRLFARTKSIRRRALVRLLAVLLALGDPMRAAAHAVTAPAARTPFAATRDASAALRTTTGSAAADTAAEQFAPDSCTLVMGADGPSQLLCPNFPPPPLVHLDQGVNVATAEQKQALENLERQAINNIIKGHGLTDADYNAVKTWGRYDALGQLYGLLYAAINTAETERTADQRHAVSWMESAAQITAAIAAQNAAREYVKWAGLNVDAYEKLLETTLSEDALTEFLSDSPSSAGWCAYRSPEPYSSEYTGYDHPSCFDARVCTGPLGCDPPSPSYDQFVKWGQAQARYSMLNSAEFADTAFQIGLSVAAGVATVAGIAALAGAASLGTTAAWTLAFEVALVGLVELSPFFTAGVSTWLTTAVGLASAAATIVGIVIVAVTIAVIRGINVAKADKLPGQLAALLVSARTTPPSAKDLAGTTDGSTTLYSNFVSATLPTPDNRPCDNSVPQLPPGITNVKGLLLFFGPPCLNPTSIPPASTNDLQFLVQERGTDAATLSPTITYADWSAGGSVKARLRKTWFVTEMNGSLAQALSIAFTDWLGQQRLAELLPNDFGGYTFVSFQVPDDTGSSINVSTCVDDGICKVSDVLEYRGSDGIDYSARVAGNSVPVGAPKISDAVEGSPTTFDANGVAPQGGTGAISYDWRFQRDGCGFDACGGSALENNQIVFHPEYGDPVSGATVQHTWQEFDTHFVELTAVAANGLRTTLQMQLPVGNVPPTLELLPDCAQGEAGGDCTPRTVPPGSNVALGGVFDDAGDLSTLSVSINWGDGTSEASRIEPDGSSVSSPVVLTKYVDETQNVDAYRFSGHHTYGAVGTYYGTVTVTDGLLFFNYGDSESKTFVITVGAQEQSIGFAALPSRTYGEEPFALAVTGGASGEPVTFDVTGSGSVCAVSTAPTGEPTVTLLGAGTCHITASQAGSGPYAAAESVTQSFDILPAPVVVHAVSLGMWYDGTVPGTGPFYEGLVHDDWPDTDATCTVDVPSGGPIGTYVASCEGASDPNYTFSYEPGTVTITQAGTALEIGPAIPETAAEGEPLTLTATVVPAQPGQLIPGVSGTIAFFRVDSEWIPIAGCEAQPVDTTTNTATCVTSAIPVGRHLIAAEYSGDANYHGSLPNRGVFVTVNEAATSTPVGASASASISDPR